MVAGVCGKRGALPKPLELGIPELERELPDEDRHVPELAEPAHAVERGDGVVAEPLLDHLEREIERRLADLPGQAHDRVDGARRRAH